MFTRHWRCFHQAHNPRCSYYCFSNGCVHYSQRLICVSIIFLAQMPLKRGMGVQSARYNFVVKLLGEPVSMQPFCGFIFVVMAERNFKKLNKQLPKEGVIIKILLRKLFFLFLFFFFQIPSVLKALGQGF